MPKAGAPLRMSTFDVNEPYTTGAPGWTSCVRVIPNSASAFCCASAAGRVTGVIAPISVNGVIATAWPWRAMVISPAVSASSKRRGEFTLMIVMQAGRCASASTVSPRAIAAMRMLSSARCSPTAVVMNGRSVSVRFAW
ncbi:MAG: hypothetical protein U5K73_00500 [Halofilum sp. (in: g-proteobacteria)]|nr:hypothetical protein [Halofilum sp. (in: g-proteobacteria)]